MNEREASWRAPAKRCGDGAFGWRDAIKIFATFVPKRCPPNAFGVATAVQNAAPGKPGTVGKVERGRRVVRVAGHKHLWLVLRTQARSVAERKAAVRLR